jgi:hypothetical protein
MVAVSIIGGRHDIAESGIKHNKSNRPEYSWNTVSWIRHGISSLKFDGDKSGWWCNKGSLYLLVNIDISIL